MSSSSIISIANRSLLSIGARAQVQSLQEDSTEANAISTLFTPTFEQLARTANWNCLRNQAVLTLLAAATGTPENPTGTTLPQPPFPYLYQYAVPSDSLQIRFLLPSFPNSQGANNIPLTTASVTNNSLYSGPSQIPFEVAYATDALNNPIQVIMTNQPQAQAVYTVNQSNPVIWDSLFQAAMVASLAAYLVPALSLNLPLMSAAIKNAEMLIAQARVRDGDEGYVTQNRNADWMTARNTGGSIGWNQDGYSLMFGNYNSMFWPG